MHGLPHPFLERLLNGAGSDQFARFGLGPKRLQERTLLVLGEIGMSVTKICESRFPASG
jgi:hypothetical protein